MPTEHPTAETELVDAPKELQVIVQKEALQPATAQSLHASFAPLFGQARSVIEKSRGIVVTDANQNLEMKLARACRLELRAIRLASDKTRKELKDESLRTGRAIDSFHTILLHLTETEEKRLQAQEDFVERKEAERKAALKADREKVLAAINVDPNLYQLDQMSEETFQQLVEGTKLARAAEADRKRKEEAERIEREQKEAAERERIRQENERLKKEADEKEAALKVERDRVAKERADAEAKAKAEREEHARKLRELEEASRKKTEADRLAREELDRKVAAERKAAEDKARKQWEAERKKVAEEKAAREKLEAEIRQKNEAEAKRIAAAAEAARKAAAAPDKDRLLNYANAVLALEIPTLSTLPELAEVIRQQRDKFVRWLESSTEKL